ncbi:MAG: IS1182 family transposase [Ktedonobacteraceae bacterium]
MHLPDALGPIYQDADFAHLFPKRGRAAEAPWRLALVTVWQAVENLSDRQAAQMVRGRLDWKYALSLPRDDVGFDASILGDFRQRLLDHQAEDLLLEPILRVCREQGGLKAGGKQRSDSTMVLANVRRLSRLESVGETLRAVLTELAEREPEWLLTVITADWLDRYVHRFELQRFPKGKQAQETLWEQVGQDSWKGLEALQAPQAPHGVSTLPVVAVLQQVWPQHFERIPGRVPGRDGPLVCNEERVVSPYDQEARQSRKRDTEWLGYKVPVTETCEVDDEVHLIVQVNTTPATTQDGEETAPLLQRLRERDLAPETLLLDRGYLSGELIVQEGHKGRQLLGPVLLDTRWHHHSGSGLAAFELDGQQRRARCPQGHSSQSWRPNTGKRGEEMIQVNFAAHVCQGCEAKALGTRSQKGGRRLTLYPQEVHETLQQRRGEQGGKAFQQAYAPRAGVEGSLSQGVRRHGLRRSRYRGLAKTQLQMTSIAAAINLVRLDALLVRKRAGLPPRRTRALSPLAPLQHRLSA